jgi:predicted negative regulator of RcsB-dependent stress response
MASHLDLEEQEQLDKLKHFWSRYGNAITWLLIVVLGTFAAWNGWNYWQRKQAVQAAVMYDEIERAAGANELDKIDRALADVKERFGSTTFAHQSALLAARIYQEQKQTDKAQLALRWVIDKASDEGLKAVAQLRLAGLLLDGKSYDQALQLLGGKFSPEFAALAADRRGDIYQAQGKAVEAKAEYQKAYAGLDAQTEYRLLVEVKLNALGAEVQAEVSK